LPVVDMTAVLLRQAVTLREMQARGEFDYWLNYDLLGLNPQSGWMEGNVVDRRAYAVQSGYYQWIEQRGGAAAALASAGAGSADSESMDAESAPVEEKPSVVKPAVPAPGGGNYPEPDLPR
jgi:hypothetical protein